MKPLDSRRLRRSFATVLIALFFVLLPSCYSIQHTVGVGPVRREVASQRQWYLFFGGLPLGERVDSARLASGATSYRVTTEWTFTDFLINIVTSPFTVTSRTITVER